MLILDPGHGGLNPKGEYTTPPNKGKQYTHQWGTFYEGVFNRAVATKCSEIAGKLGVRHIILPHEYEDTNLYVRVNMANNYYSIFPDTVYVSIHANATGGKFRASGYESYIHPGSMSSRILAEMIHNAILDNMSVPRKYTSMYHLKSRNPVIKEKEEFLVLNKTKCPATLLELGFFDHPEESKWLLNEDVQWIFAHSIVQGYLFYQKFIKDSKDDNVRTA